MGKKFVYMSNRQNMFCSNCKMSSKEEPSMARSVCAHHGIEFKFEIRELNALFSLEANAFVCATECVCLCTIVSLDLLLNYDKTTALCGNAQNMHDACVLLWFPATTNKRLRKLSWNIFTNNALHMWSRANWWDWKSERMNWMGT